mmetsp:Transcript_2755/g.7000  ORF Transcript_2755/g.7000 Transcript_2755/m.7000 type:complete len:140 (-) Transcript_2755:315-734(-)
MKPAWDQLGDAYAGSSSVLIADVDCTSDEGQSVCNDNGVSGYPTIKYFTAETGKKGEAYKGGRSFDHLDKFVKITLARCDPKTKEDCDDKEKEYIDKMVSKGQEKIAAELQLVMDMKVWLMKRISILQGLQGSEKAAEL